MCDGVFLPRVGPPGESRLLVFTDNTPLALLHLEKAPHRPTGREFVWVGRKRSERGRAELARYTLYACAAECAVGRVYCCDIARCPSPTQHSLMGPSLYDPASSCLHRIRGFVETPRISEATIISHKPGPYTMVFVFCDVIICKLSPSRSYPRSE